MVHQEGVPIAKAEVICSMADVLEKKEVWGYV